jgi:bifunctional DNA-binding transcriptional regulator/antitoxin component of YhaV-PrlF toxin-antitoxin module
MTTLPVSKRGSLTLPPALRRKMGLDKLRNPMLLVEERDGGLFLHPAMALPVRDLPKAQIKARIARERGGNEGVPSRRESPQKVRLFLDTSVLLAASGSGRGCIAFPHYGSHGPRLGTRQLRLLQ